MSLLPLSELTFLRQEKKAYSNVGEPTEASLKVLVEKIGYPCDDFSRTLTTLDTKARVAAVNSKYESEITRLMTFDFSRDRKMMSVLVRRKDGTGSLFVKGAPESVLDRCTSVEVNGTTIPLSSPLRNAILERMAVYSQSGLRTLAIAYSNRQDLDVSHYSSKSTAEYSRFERDLVFVSLVGMLDPPRPEARDAVLKCRAAGIRVICITGDNKGTAEAICRQVGIFEDKEPTDNISYTGREFDLLSNEEKIEAVKRAKLFSRTEPSHKSQLVDLLQQLGLVVAMVSKFAA